MSIQISLMWRIRVLLFFLKLLSMENGGTPRSRQAVKSWKHLMPTVMISEWCQTTSRLIRSATAISMDWHSLQAWSLRWPDGKMVLTVQNSSILTKCSIPGLIQTVSTTRLRLMRVLRIWSWVSGIITLIRFPMLSMQKLLINTLSLPKLSSRQAYSTNQHPQQVLPSWEISTLTLLVREPISNSKIWVSEYWLLITKWVEIAV